MAQEWHKTARVQAGGRIELIVAELREGDQVDVVVRQDGAKHRRAKAPRVFGSLAGEIWMSPDFDAPLDDFRDYM